MSIHPSGRQRTDTRDLSEAMASTVKQRKSRRWRRVFLAVVAAAALLLFWRCAERPDPTTRTLAAGVRYELRLIDDPRRIVVHILQAELKRAKIVVTPPAAEGELPLRAQTTSEFAETHGLDAAINGDFFAPWHSYHPWNYYPRRGDPVGPHGFAVGEGVSYGGKWVPGHTVFFSCEGGATDEAPEQPCAAISGKRLLRNGEVVARDRWRHPRTAVCWDDKLITLVVVDGRQWGYSGGMRLNELAGLLTGLGCRDAINLDGGGSTTMALRGADGRVAPVNRPMHTRVIGRERPVANHLGLRFVEPEGP